MRGAAISLFLAMPLGAKWALFDPLICKRPKVRPFAWPPYGRRSRATIGRRRHGRSRQRHHARAFLTFGITNLRPRHESEGFVVCRRLGCCCLSSSFAYFFGSFFLLLLAFGFGFVLCWLASCLAFLLLDFGWSLFVVGFIGWSHPAGGSRRA